MAPKAKVSAKKPTATSAKSRPKGLQLSSAQWKAYNQAYNAVAKAGFAALRAQQQTALRRQQFAAAVQRLRAQRLKAAASLAQKAAVRHAVAQRTAIAAYAAKQSSRQAILGHQNSALRARVHADFIRHVTNAQRAQYAYKGVKAYAHTAVMRTLTDAQATSAVQAQQAKAAGTAKAAVKSTSTAHKQAASPAFQAAAAKIRAQAQAAGLAAAAAVPASRGRGRPRKASTVGTARQKRPATRSTGQRKTAGTRTAKAKRTTSASIKSAKKPAATVTRAGRTAVKPEGVFPLTPRERLTWFGDPEGYDCVAAAIANSLLHATGYRLSFEQYADLVFELGEAPCLEDALGRVRDEPPWYPEDEVPRLTHVTATRAFSLTGSTVLGFPTENGPHAALQLQGRRIASWGDVYALVDIATGAVEEAWTLSWKTVG